MMMLLSHASQLELAIALQDVPRSMMLIEIDRAAISKFRPSYLWASVTDAVAQCSY